MLLCYEKEADLIAAVGTHFSLTDFLEKSRGGMSSTFLVRLKVGSLLVDAKGISRLYPTTQSSRFFIYLMAIAWITALVLLVESPAIRGTLGLWMLRLLSFAKALHL